MQKDFTKADLKDGMVVEYKDGRRRLVVADMLIGKDGFLTLNSYSEELKSNSFDEHTIVKTYKIREAATFDCVLDNINLELIWKRTETKHMTTEEMRTKLEELTGEKIEVELSREEMVGACYGFCRNQKCLDGCPLFKIGSCHFKNYSNERLKECYEKVIVDGKK